MAMMVPMANPEPRLGREIGERLDALRRARGWTQGQLVNKTKLDKSTVYQILAGARKDPPVGTVMRFAEALDVDIRELLGLKPLQLPERVEPDTQLDPQVADRMNNLEKNLFDMRAEILEIVKRQESVLKDLQAERAAPRKRSKPA